MLRIAIFLGVSAFALSTSAVADPPPPPAASASAAAHVTFLAMPFVGFHSYQNVDMKSYWPGPRVGAIVGARLLPWLSLNAEGTYDRSLIQSIEGDPGSEYFADFAVSPLFHFPAGPAEIVVGPEVGYFLRSHSGQLQTTTHIDDSSTGFAVGLNAGVFARMNRHVSLGALLSFELRNARRYCETAGSQPEVCTTNQVLNSGVVLHDADLFSVSFAALF
jgi:hypothetical protein